MSALVEAKHVSKRFGKPLDFAQKIVNAAGGKIEAQTVHAVSEVDLAIAEGEVVGLVGESGSGKSTLGRMMAKLLPVSDGQILWRGRDWDELTGHDARQARLEAQMIFQDPLSSLNPRKRVSDIIGEAPLYHGLVRRNELNAYVDHMMEQVGLDPSYRDRLPHQFSGGQRQRIGIARALAVKPRFLVCDESVAALDVSIQAQVINLFLELRRKLNLTYLFISHDLGVVEHISDRVAILHLGRIVEVAPTEELFAHPNHPYTVALLENVPHLHKKRASFTALEGELPSPLAPPSGCHFHGRCPHADERCKSESPELVEISPGHWSSCHRNDEAR